MNRKQSLTFFNLVLLLFVVTGSASCNRDRVSEENPVAIHLFYFENTAIPDELDKSDLESWKPLQNIDLSKSDFTITENDIVGYDWELQEISLASDLISRIELNEYGGIDYSFFIIALGDTPIFGGVLLPYPSAIYSDIPVLFVPQNLEDMKNNAEFVMLLRGNSVFYAEEGLIFKDELDKNLFQRLTAVGKIAK